MRTQSIFIALMAVLMFVIIISGSALVVLYALTNSTKSLTSTQNITRAPIPAQQKERGIILGTPIPPPRPASGNQVLTTLVYLPQLSTSNAYFVKQGETVTWAFGLRNNNGMSISDKWVNFYIDDQAAKGTWYKSPDVRLVYSGTDSASLSPGVHTLKLDFLGDDTNAPCRYAITFTVAVSSNPSSTTVTVIIQNFAFTPFTVTVARGTTVVWTNQQAGVPHTVISDTNAFASGTLNTGASFRFQFNTPGTYHYHCSIHPSMIGTVVVT